MKFDKFVKALTPVFAIAIAAGVSGCDRKVKIDTDTGKVTVTGHSDGKKLSELDLTGPVPDELVLAGPDEVQLTQGDKLAITVDGDPDAAAKLRFALKDGTLSVMREGKWFGGDGSKRAVVHVTMLAPKSITMAGSGKITAPVLAREAKVTVAGSGEIEAPALAGDKLDLTIAGSGSFRGAGAVKQLDLTIAGSGSAALGGAKTDNAKVTIAGSGDAAFASDGNVEATIMGSGSVKVTGRARCKVSAMGSGELICENGVTNEDGDGAKTDAPTAPPAPAAAPKKP